MEGWIKLHRKTMSHYLFTENRVFSKFEAWMYIIMMANHTENKFLLGNELIELQPGQFVTSQSKLMITFSWSKSKLMGFLQLLKKDGMLDYKSDTKKTTLTVVKYEHHQGLKTAKRPQIVYEKTANSLPIDTNKNDNNDNNDKEDKEKTTKVVIDFDFDVYIKTINESFGKNHRVATPKLKRQIKSLLKTGLTKDDIMTAIDNCKNSEFHKAENYRHCTPEFFSRIDKVDYWSDVKEVKKQNIEL